MLCDAPRSPEKKHPKPKPLTPPIHIRYTHTHTHTNQKQIDDAAKGAWVEVQKKAFTRWANSHLKQKGCPEIGDLFTDTSDGE